MNYFFCGDRPEPILESIKRWRNSCGEDAWAGIKVIKRLLDAARAQGVPVIYTTGNARPDLWNRGSWRWKNNRAGEDAAGRAARGDVDGTRSFPTSRPRRRTSCCYKDKPSAFFGTPLLSYLVLLGCDSLIVTGTTTSGCVRATVLDAFSNNYRVTVVEDALLRPLAGLARDRACATCTPSTPTCARARRRSTFSKATRPGSSTCPPGRRGDAAPAA